MSQRDETFLEKLEYLWYILVEIGKLLKQEIDIQAAMAKIGGLLTYLLTYVVSIETYIPKFFLGKVSLGDEIVIGLVRAVFAIGTALMILMLSDGYKFLKKKLKAKFDIN